LIYIGVPAHNERHTIGLLLWKLRSLLTEHGRDFHMLVVDDASTDATAERLEPYQRVLPLTVLSNETRQGYAASLERLVREAVSRSDYPKRDGLLILQGDFSEAPEFVPDMVKRFEGGADVVAGCPSIDRTLPRSLRVARLGGAILARGLPLPEEVEDRLCGFRLYRLMPIKRALAGVPEGERLLRHEGWAANAELLVAMWPHVRRFENMEFPLDYRRHSRTSRFEARRQLWQLFRVGRDKRLRQLRSDPGEA
jgi:glycosyltransferase involved in cell wall biosynthesis